MCHSYKFKKLLVGYPPLFEWLVKYQIYKVTGRKYNINNLAELKSTTWYFL